MKKSGYILIGLGVAALATGYLVLRKRWSSPGANAVGAPANPATGLTSALTGLVTASSGLVKTFGSLGSPKPTTPDQLQNSGASFISGSGGSVETSGGNSQDGWAASLAT